MNERLEGERKATQDEVLVTVTKSSLRCFFKRCTESLLTI